MLPPASLPAVYNPRMNFRWRRGDSKTPNRSLFLHLCVALFGTITSLSACAAAQSAPARVPVEKAEASSHIMVRRLSPPIYPQIARIAGTAGDVIVNVSVRPDGGIASVTPMSGAPVLAQAAVESAKLSQFECRGCGNSTETESFIYSFRQSQDKPDPCCCTSGPGIPKKPAPGFQVLQSGNHITITAPPLCVCPDECSFAWAKAHSRFRSAKCLYLWKCGKRKIYVR